MSNQNNKKVNGVDLSFILSVVSIVVSIFAFSIASRTSKEYTNKALSSGEVVVLGNDRADDIKTKNVNSEKFALSDNLNKNSVGIVPDDGNVNEDMVSDVSDEMKYIEKEVRNIESKTENPVPVTTNKQNEKVFKIDVNNKITKKRSSIVKSAYSVQIGVFPSKASAEDKWKRLYSSNKSIFNKHDRAIVAGPKNAKGIDTYRLRVVGFADKSSATKLCKKLSSAGISCFVVFSSK